MNNPSKGNDQESLQSATEDMQPEYTVDYTKAKPNRFAEHIKAGGRLIVLDSDVAQAFPTDESVNTLLRAILKAIPSTEQSTLSRG
jgi:hypothetical protein